MPITKFQFAQDVLQSVYDLCKVVYGVKNKEEIQRIFGVNFEKLDEIVRKVVNALPDELFMQDNKARIKEIEQILAKEFIFFEVQERTDDPQYANDLENFILLFARDMHLKLQSWKEGQMK